MLLKVGAIASALVNVKNPDIDQIREEKGSTGHHQKDVNLIFGDRAVGVSEVLTASFCPSVADFQLQSRLAERIFIWEEEMFFFVFLEVTPFNFSWSERFIWKKKGIVFD